MVNSKMAQALKEYNEIKAAIDKFSSNSSHVTFDETQMQALRTKTNEVEEIGNKVDEILRIHGDIDQQILRLGRCDEKLLAELKAKCPADSVLKQKVHDILQELEKFPRKNRHSQEWYEKYYSKFCQLTEQSTSIEQTQSGIKTLLQNLDTQKQKALEENFLQLNANFKQIFS